MGRYLALVPMALALAACGGGGGSSGGLSLDPVARAADRTSKAGSVRFTLTIAGGTSSGKYISATAQGVADNADGSTRMAMAFTEAGKTVHARAVVLGNDFYMNAAFLRSKLPSGKSWVKVDMKKLAKEVGGDTSLFDQSQQETPTAPLQALRKVGKTVKVGPAVVAGVPTTKYHATVDAARIDKKLSDQGVKHVPIDVWIDHKQMVRKISVDVSAPNPNNSGTFTYVLRSFGPAVTIEPPPSDQTVDIFDLK
jgi:LppX_LprAFG lipoprotein